MGIFADKKQQAKQSKAPETVVVQLTQEELNIILQLIKNSNFNGDMIDSLYHLTTKLQLQYKGE